MSVWLCVVCRKRLRAKRTCRRQKAEFHIHGWGVGSLSIVAHHLGSLCAKMTWVPVLLISSVESIKSCAARMLPPCQFAHLEGVHGITKVGWDYYLTAESSTPGVASVDGDAIAGGGSVFWECCAIRRSLLSLATCRLRDFLSTFSFLSSFCSMMPSASIVDHPAVAADDQAADSPGAGSCQSCSTGSANSPPSCCGC